MKSKSKKIAAAKKNSKKTSKAKAAKPAKPIKKTKPKKQSKKKNPVGRPRAFQTVKQMQTLIDEYFNNCDGKDAKGKPDKTIEKRPYTMAGMIVWLDVCDDTFGTYKAGHFDDLENNFSETIGKARKKVEMTRVEQGLMGKSNPTMTIFDLKNNFGYTDKLEQKTYDLTPTIIKDDIPDE